MSPLLHSLPLRRLQPLLAPLCLLALAGPARAQVATGPDAPALGGSKVFSEGWNPYGNPARLDLAKPGVYLHWAEGDAKGPETARSQEDLARTDAALRSSALRELGRDPVSQRARSYGLNFLDYGIVYAYSRQELSACQALADLDPAHLVGDAALALNTSAFRVRRATVDRVAIGSGSNDRGTAMGFLLRVERWRMGEARMALNPASGSTDLPVTADPLGLAPEGPRTTAVALDLGLVHEFGRTFRGGLTVDRVNARRIWDVNEKPQLRVGLQMDLSDHVSLSAEQDLNRCERMPLPVRQRAGSVSLRIRTGAESTLLLGMERREIGDSRVTRSGATLLTALGRLRMGFGFQFSNDRPIKALAVQAW